MSARFGHESRHNKTLNLDFWLNVGRGTNGSDRPSVKITASYPSLARNERAMNLKIELPLALFEIPSLTAKITVDSPEQQVTLDTTAIAEAVCGCIGMDVSISVAEPEAQS